MSASIRYYSKQALNDAFSGTAWLWIMGGIWGDYEIWIGEGGHIFNILITFRIQINITRSRKPNKVAIGVASRPFGVAMATPGPPLFRLWMCCILLCRCNNILLTLNIGSGVRSWQSAKLHKRISFFDHDINLIHRTPGIQREYFDNNGVRFIKNVGDTIYMTFNLEMNSPCQSVLVVTA